MHKNTNLPIHDNNTIIRYESLSSNSIPAFSDFTTLVPLPRDFFFGGYNILYNTFRTLGVVRFTCIQIPL